MPDMPIGSNLPPISGPDSGTPISPAQAPAPKITGPQDSVSQAQSTAKQSEIVADVPVLSPPQTKHTSFLDYLSQINRATSQSRVLQQESQQADFMTAQQRHQTVNGIIKDIEDQYADLSNYAVTAKSQTNELISFVSTTNKQIEDLVKKQNELIKSLQSGNTEEKKQGDTLSKAYDTYIKGLKDLGAKDLGGGVYSIPDTPEAKQQYEKLTADYQKAVNNYNSYSEGRTAEINQFNTQIQSLVNEANQINQTIADFSEEHDFDYAGLNAPTANLRETTPPTVSLPAAISTNPTKVSVSAPPSGIKNAPATMTNLSYAPVKTDYDTLYNQIYEQGTLELESQIAADLALINLLQSPSLQSSNDPILNSKPIADALLDESGQSQNSEKLKEKLLGKQIMDQFFQNEELDTAKKEIIEKKLMALSQELIKLSGRDALLSSLEATGSALGTMSKEDPTFAIQYAVSFADAIVDSVKSGLVAKAVEAFIEQTPELANLPPERKAELSCAINIGQLALAGKFLEANIGAPHLLSDVLFSAMDESQAGTLKNQSAQDNRAYLNGLTTEFKQSFASKGFSNDQAEFLAKFAADGIENASYLAPTQAKVTAATINTEVLINSLTSSILLAKKGELSLTQALMTASRAVNEALTDKPVSSTEGFRKALETQLQGLGMRDISVKSSKEAMIIPANINVPVQVGHMINQIGGEIANQTAGLKEKNSAYAESINDLISGTGQSSLSINSFLSNLMQPAYWIASAISTERASRSMNTSELIGRG